MTLRSFLVLFSLALSVTLGLVLARGGGPAAEAKRSRPRIGLSLDTLKEARWQGDRDALVARARELGADVIVQSANSDDVKQVADVKALLTAGIDALVVVAHDGVAMGQAVRLAHASGVPVLSYDRLIRDADVDLFISTDNVRMGVKQAAYLTESLPHSRERPLRIVRILGARTDNNVHQIKQGQDSVLDPLIRSGELQIVFDDWAEDWKPEAAKRITNAAITQYGASFQAVLAANDGTAGGAIQALEEEGLTGKVVVTGQDADLVALQRIARGVQAMTIYKPLRSLAGQGAELAVKLATGKPIIARDEVDNGKRKVPAVLFDMTVVTRENLRQTVIADGFASEQAVYGP
ncbi:MAG TPA: substrate-binding domain-containing protein [Polyangiales bacterium]|nr:substrate-binding domain-containing protein [Polyangiales bacterium]